MKLTSKSGFTLAEVLITLGIIGVVAAMTMPTLMNQTNGAQFRTAYKKALSAISQAVTLNVALEEWNFADTTATSTGADDLSIYSMLNKRMNVVRKETAAITGYNVALKSSDTALGNATAVGASNYTLFFNDGIMLTFAQSNKECTMDETRGGSRAKACKGFIDVNGPTLPNKEVRCSAASGAVASSVGNCIVRNNASDMGDIFPVVFHDGTVEPITDAGRYVLNQSK